MEGIYRYIYFYIEVYTNIPCDIKKEQNLSIVKLLKWKRKKEQLFYHLLFDVHIFAVKLLFWKYGSLVVGILVFCHFTRSIKIPDLFTMVLLNN